MRRKLFPIFVIAVIVLMLPLTRAATSVPTLQTDLLHNYADYCDGAGKATLTQNRTVAFYSPTPAVDTYSLSLVVELYIVKLPATGGIVVQVPLRYMGYNVSVLAYLVGNQSEYSMNVTHLDDTNKFMLIQMTFGVVESREVPYTLGIDFLALVRGEFGEFGLPNDTSVIRQRTGFIPANVTFPSDNWTAAAAGNYQVAYLAATGLNSTDYAEIYLTKFQFYRDNTSLFTAIAVAVAGFFITGVMVFAVRRRTARIR